LAALALSVCTVAGPEFAAAQPARAATTQAMSAACSANLTTEGSFMRGRRWKTQATAAGVTVQAAVVNIARALATDGHWKDIRADRDIGTVTAVQDIPGGSKQMPLSMILKPEGSAVSVEAILTTPPMIASSAEGVKKAICEIVEAADG